MMNERFLSKAKRKDNSKWIDGCYCEHEHMGKTIAHNILVTDSLDDFYPYEIDVNTLCQCTGLPTKNGQFAYAYDMLTEEDGIGIEEFYILEYENNVLVLANYDYDGDTWYSESRTVVEIDTLFALEKMEIIGNIHD